MQVKRVTVTTVPSDALAFRILRNSNPVEGADVVLCTKGIIPLSFTRVTDEGGVALFSGYDITGGQIPLEAIKEIPWLFMASIPESEYAVWNDNVRFDVGKLHEIKLKKYTKPPVFFVKIELRDLIGAELFSSFIAEVEKAALGWAGLEVVDVTGVGTRLVTVYFQPPWHESPIVVEWGTVWFILKVLAVAGAIIAVLYMLKWTFGEKTAEVVGGGFLLLLVLGGLVLAKPIVEKARERE